MARRKQEFTVRVRLQEHIEEERDIQVEAHTVAEARELAIDLAAQLPRIHGSVIERRAEVISE